MMPAKWFGLLSPKFHFLTDVCPFYPIRCEAVDARWCQAFHIPCGKLLDPGQLDLNPSHSSHFLRQKEPLLWLPGGPVFGILWALVPQCIHGFSTQRASISAVRAPCFHGELGVHDDSDPLNGEERGQWKGKYNISTQRNRMNWQVLAHLLLQWWCTKMGGIGGQPHRKLYGRWRPKSMRLNAC